MLNKQERSRLSQELSDDDLILTASSLFPPYQPPTRMTFEQEYSIRYSSLSSRQTNITNDARIVSEPRDAFTATYLLRRLNTLFPMQYVRGMEREQTANPANNSSTTYHMLGTTSRIDEDNPTQGITDTEADLDMGPLNGENRSDDGRQQLSNYVTSRVSSHLNERVLGLPRSAVHPKSSNVISLQNRTILDIRAIQAPTTASNPKRLIDQYQQQRHRVAMSITKQYNSDANESVNSLGLRSIPLSEKKTDDSSYVQDNSSVASSRTVPARSDNMPVNMVSRYDASTLTQLTSLNRMQTIKISSLRKPNK